jgi:hypothetical protein
VRTLSVLALVLVGLFGSAACGGGDDDDSGGEDTSNGNPPIGGNNGNGASAKSGTMTLDGKEYKLTVEQCALPQTSNKIFGAAAKTTDGKGQLGISGAQDMGIMTLSYDGTAYLASQTTFKFDNSVLSYDGPVLNSSNGKEVPLKLKLNC